MAAQQREKTIMNEAASSACAGGSRPGVDLADGFAASVATGVDDCARVGTIKVHIKQMRSYDCSLDTLDSLETSRTISSTNCSVCG